MLKEINMINYQLYNSKEETALALAKTLAEKLQNSKDQKVNIALSGGSTPFIMFDALETNFGDSINWDNIHFFWVDERCVEPTSNESNYGNTKKTLFDKIDIPEENIHRVLGEEDPAKEALRYSKEIDDHVSMKNSLPQFDIILLGMGDDGHTASIFPPEIELLKAKENAVVGKNPYSGQLRITLTGTIINNAAQIIFLVTGASKAPILEQIVNKKNDYLKFPAAHISTLMEQTEWYLDKDAAPFL